MLADEEPAADAEEATEQRVPVHPLTDLPASSSDVRATYILPDTNNNGAPFVDHVAELARPALALTLSAIAQCFTQTVDVVYAVFFLGEVSTIVVGFQNTGAKNINVTAIFGSLNSPFQYRMFIQNVSLAFLF